MGLFTVEELREVISVKVLAGRTPRIRQAADQTASARIPDRFAVAICSWRSGASGSTVMSSCRRCLRKGAAGAIVHDEYRLPRRETQQYAGSRGGRRRFSSACAIRCLPINSCDASSQSVPYSGRGGDGEQRQDDDKRDGRRRCWLNVGRTLKTEGNFNNRIGVPYTLFRLTARHQAAVIEMGVDQHGQTTSLCEMVSPTIGVITNIGPDHLEFFGSMEGSAQAKAELLDMLPPDGTAVLNADDPYFDYLAARARCRVMSFGFSERADVRAAASRPMPEKARLSLACSPARAAPRSFESKCMGPTTSPMRSPQRRWAFCLEPAGFDDCPGAGRFRPAAMRSQVVTHHGVQIINDCYNANPASMKAALQLLAQWTPARERIAVLGDMLELGAEASRMHRDVGRFLAGQGLSRLIVCGNVGSGDC